jgi:hypothetical protein
MVMGANPPLRTYVPNLAATGRSANSRALCPLLATRSGHRREARPAPYLSRYDPLFLRNGHEAAGVSRRPGWRASVAACGAGAAERARAEHHWISGHGIAPSLCRPHYLAGASGRRRPLRWARSSESRTSRLLSRLPSLCERTSSCTRHRQKNAIGRDPSSANQTLPPFALFNSLNDVNGTTQRCSTPSQEFQCLLAVLRMLVTPPSGSIQQLFEICR